MNLLQRVSASLHSHIPSGARILVAVSGGPDSVALLHTLRGMPYRLVVGHVDHKLRRTSGADARFVSRLCREWDIPCVVSSQNVKAFAKKLGMGIEEAARTVRYQALQAIAKKSRAIAIVTAHTADDQSETVLMNFLRGSGASGLAGMPETRNLNHGSNVILVRPLLGIRKNDILLYLKAERLAYRTDPSNRSYRFTRNRIRHQALPYLESLSPGLKERLAQSADIFRQEESFWEEQMKAILDQAVQRSGMSLTVVLPKLLGYHKALSRRILHHILPGSSFQDIEQVLRMARSSGKRSFVDLQGDWHVVRKNDKLVVTQKRSG